MPVAKRDASDRARIRVRIAAPSGSYDAWIGRGLCEKLPREWAAQFASRGSRAFVIADRNVAVHTTQLVRALKRAGWRVTVKSVTAGESFKDFAKLYPLYGWLLQEGADRHSVLFAVGGGVIGDAVGFLAATYLRGIRWIGVPTTLVAQVDSAFGGKTAVNHTVGKNLVGAFHQPAAVLCDLATLDTLPKREMISGLGEILKYGLIYDSAFYKWVAKHWRGLAAGEAGLLTRAVASCVRFKAGVIARDERDDTGVREVLNFGHTVAHALERETGYGYFRHGEAVLLGMRAAVRLSALRGFLRPPVAEAVIAQLMELPVPKFPRGLSETKIIGALKFDKKTLNGKVRFVLLRSIGQTCLDRQVTQSEVRQVVRELVAAQRRGTQ